MARVQMVARYKGINCNGVTADILNASSDVLLSDWLFWKRLIAIQLVKNIDSAVFGGNLHGEGIALTKDESHRPSHLVIHPQQYKVLISAANLQNITTS